MKKMTIMFFIAALLLPMSGVFAEEKKFEGEVSATVTGAEVDGNEAKFNEYGGRDEGIRFGVDTKLKFNTDRVFLNFEASEILYDTQSYRLDGGLRGAVQGFLEYREFPHNTWKDARTFYSGAGHDSLTGTTNTNTQSWDEYDLSIDRSRMGAGLRIDALNPFYLKIAAHREITDGIKLTSSDWGTGSSGPFVELPEPVDYTTDTVEAEVGYSRKPFFISLNYMLSRFDNADEILSYQDDGTTRMDRVTLPPDNDFDKYAVKAAVDLPLHSKLMGTYSKSKAKSNWTLFSTFLEGGAPHDLTYSGGVSKFHGKVETENQGIALTTNPVSFLTAKAFWKSFKKMNESDEIDVFIDGTFDSRNELFEYRTSSCGLEVGAKLPANFNLTAGYTRLDTKREYRELPNTDDDTFSIGLRWTGLDFMAASIGYEKLDREGEGDLDYIIAFDNLLYQFARRYDIASQERDTLTVGVEVYPTDYLNLALAYKSVVSNYTETYLGLQKETRDVWLLDADLTLGEIAKVAGYVDYEMITQDEFLRRGTSDPFGPLQSATHNNFRILERNESWNYGIGSDIYVLPKKLTLRLQYDQFDSDGTADFTFYTAAGLPAGADNSQVDSGHWGDYKRQAFMAKAILDVTPAVSVSAGYAYEDYTFRDAQYDYYPATDYFVQGGNTSFLSGYGSDPDYTANVVFVTASYKF